MHLGQGAAVFGEHHSDPWVHHAYTRLCRWHGCRFPLPRHFRQKSRARSARFVEQFISARTVVADRRRRYQHSRRRLHSCDCHRDRFRASRAAVQDAALPVLVPPSADRLPGQMHHGVYTFQRSGIELATRIPQTRRQALAVQYELPDRPIAAARRPAHSRSTRLHL